MQPWLHERRDAAQQPVAVVWPYVDLLDPRSLGVLAIRDVEYVHRDAAVA
nr:hypothetical protein RAR13_09340 [Aminobacter aminovorans]